MKTKTTNSGIKVKASVKAGGLNINHNHGGLRVQAGLKAGTTPMRPNHTPIALAIK